MAKNKTTVRTFPIEDGEWNKFCKECKKVERTPSAQIRLLIKEWMKKRMADPYA